MLHDWDVIVAGGGAGGATFAYACARAGKSILLLERGRHYTLDKPVHDQRAMLIEKRPYDDRDVEVNGTRRRLYAGGVLGGGSALYGAALLRPSVDDFHPGRYYGHRIPRAIWDWPITYADLEPYYSEAECLYGVAGSGDEDFGPLQRPRNYPKPPLPLHPINTRLMAANRASGLRPFRLPLAIDPARCLRCGPCAGYICPTGARSSSAHLVERARSSSLPLQVRTNVEVERFLVEENRVAGVALHDRATGQRSVCRAKRYVLAAGALASPLLLLRSGFNSATACSAVETPVQPAFRWPSGASSFNSATACSAVETARDLAALGVALEASIRPRPAQPWRRHASGLDNPLVAARFNSATACSAVETSAHLFSIAPLSWLQFGHGLLSRGDFFASGHSRSSSRLQFGHGLLSRGDPLVGTGRARRRIEASIRPRPAQPWRPTG